MKNSNKIILDLCGGTGAWSKPYKDAGYDVRLITLPQFDIRETFMRGDGYLIFPMAKQYGDTMLIDKKRVYGILAAPPCTMFSLARTTAKIPRDLDSGLEIVGACLKIIWKAKPHFWVMENPRGLLRKPAFAFDASEFGEEYNKHTDLWGYFKEPRRTRKYIRYQSTDKNTRKLPDIPSDYVLDRNMSKIAIKRSITPVGFAQAFYQVNQ